MFGANEKGGQRNRQKNYQSQEGWKRKREKERDLSKKEWRGEKKSVKNANCVVSPKDGRLLDAHRPIRYGNTVRLYFIMSCAKKLLFL